MRGRAFDFALNIVDVYRNLCSKSEGRVLGTQLLRAGTSIGANLEEADVAFSKAEFRAKVGISLKEAKECLYWLRLIECSRICTDNNIKTLQNGCDQLVKIMYRILKPKKIEASK